MKKAAKNGTRVVLGEIGANGSHEDNLHQNRPQPSPEGQVAALVSPGGNLAKLDDIFSSESEESIPGAFAVVNHVNITPPRAEDVDANINSGDVVARLRVRPDIAHLYSTPGALRLSQRRKTPPYDYFERFDIPSEVIYSIFKYLNKRDLVNAMKTCKRFREVGYSYPLWDFIDLGDKCLNSSSLHSLLSRGTRVLRLSKTNIKRDDDPSLEGAVFTSNALACKLTHIDLSMSAYKDTSIIAEILERCTSLLGISFENNEVDKRICLAIARNRNLEYLNMSLCSGIETDGLKAICKGCHKLKELNLAWAHLTADHVKILCQMLPWTLRRLNISGITEEGDLTDRDISDLVKTCHYLVELDLSDAPSITEVSLKEILTIRCFKDLSVSRCYGIDPSKLMLARGLHSLNVYGCVTEEGVTILRNHLKPTLINKDPFSTVARPTVGEHRTSIWGMRTRDIY